MAKKLHRRLEQLGAAAMVKAGLSDEQHDLGWVPWGLTTYHLGWVLNTNLTTHHLGWVLNINLTTHHLGWALNTNLTTHHLGWALNTNLTSFHLGWALNTNNYFLPPHWPCGLSVCLESGRPGVPFLLALGFFRVKSYQWLKYWGFLTRMVYLYYISCLRYTILVGNPLYWHSSGYPARRLAI